MQLKIWVSLWTPQKLNYSPLVSVGIPKSMDAQIPYIICNRTIRNGPSTSVDSQPGIENTFLLHPPLVESIDAELADTEDRLYISWKPLPVSACVSNPVFKGHLHFYFLLISMIITPEASLKKLGVTLIKVSILLVRRRKNSFYFI